MSLRVCGVVVGIVGQCVVSGPLAGAWREHGDRMRMRTEEAGGRKVDEKGGLHGGSSVDSGLLTGAISRPLLYGYLT